MIATGILVSTKERLETVCADILGCTYIDGQASEAMQDHITLGVETRV